MRRVQDEAQHREDGNYAGNGWSADGGDLHELRGPAEPDGFAAGSPATDGGAEAE